VFEDKAKAKATGAENEDEDKDTALRFRGASRTRISLRGHITVLNKLRLCLF